MNPRISVIVPCFNEEATIRELLRRVLEQTEVREVIVVDDASTDASLSKVSELTDSRLKIVTNITNLGKGASVAKGISLATSNYVLIQDADLEYSPEEYSKLIKPLDDGYADAVFGSRFLPSEARRALYFWHSMGNKFLTLTSNIFTNLYLTDMETCYKVMRIEFAQRLNLRETRFGIEPEITSKLAKMGARIYEVPISYHGRTYEDGKKITWKDGVSALLCILKYGISKEEL